MRTVTMGTTLILLVVTVCVTDWPSNGPSSIRSHRLSLTRCAFCSQATERIRERNPGRQLVGLVAHASSVVHQEAPPTRSVWDGVYTEEQARRGEALYQQECALCHLATLTGGESAPPLAGADFLANWNGLTLGDLFERLRISMPPDQPERLTRQQKIEILAYMLSVNKFPAGPRELPRETYQLNQIRVDASKP